MKGSETLSKMKEENDKQTKEIPKKINDMKDNLYKNLNKIKSDMGKMSIQSKENYEHLKNYKKENEEIKYINNNNELIEDTENTENNNNNNFPVQYAKNNDKNKYKFKSIYFRTEISNNIR